MATRRSRAARRAAASSCAVGGWPGAALWAVVGRGGAVGGWPGAAGGHNAIQRERTDKVENECGMWLSFRAPETSFWRTCARKKSGFLFGISAPIPTTTPTPIRLSSPQDLCTVMSPSRMLAGSLPCLAFHHGAHRPTVLFDVSEKKPIAGEIDELKNKSICPTTHGFMLIRCPTSMSTFLWNPQDRGKIELPPLPVEHDLLIDCTCLLSDKPAAPSCIVLLVEPYATFMWYCQIGDGQWRKYDYDTGTLPLPDLQSYEKEVIAPIAACGGKFYFNSTRTELGVIDFCPDPVFSSIAIDDAIDETYGVAQGPAKVFLVESKEELYMVSLLCVTSAKTIYGASIHRMDFSKQRWRKVHDLGGQTFLLSLFNFGAMCSTGKSGLRENCVYISYPWEKTLHIFNVQDGSMESQKLDEAPASDKAFWMLPADT